MSYSKEFTNAILWACIEDYAGLWELIWEINSAFPEIRESQRHNCAMTVLAELINQGAVQLYRCQEPYGDLSPIVLSDALKEIVDPKNWEPPELNAVSIRVSASPLGNEIYNKEN